MSEKMDRFAQWLIDNEDKKGTEDFETIASAFKEMQKEQKEIEDKTLKPPEFVKKIGQSDFVQKTSDISKTATQGIADFAGANTTKILGYLGEKFTKIAPGEGSLPFPLDTFGSLKYKTAIEYDNAGQPIVKEGRLDPAVSIFDEPSIKKVLATKDKKKYMDFSNDLKGYVTLDGIPFFWDDVRDKIPTVEGFLKDAEKYDARQLIFKSHRPYELDYTSAIKKYTETKEGEQKQAGMRAGLNAPVQRLVDYISDPEGRFKIDDAETLAIIAKMEESGELGLRSMVGPVYDTFKFFTADAAAFVGRTTQRFINFGASGQFQPYSSKRDREVFNDRWLASSADDLRKRLLTAGMSPMYATEELAQGLLAYSPTLTDRGTKVLIEVKSFTKALGLQMTRSAKNEFVKFKNYVAARPRKFKMDANGNMTKGTYEEAIKAYIKKEHNPSRSLFGRFKNNIVTDNLVRGAELEALKIPTAQKEIIKSQDAFLKQLFEKRFSIKKSTGYDKDELIDINREIKDASVKKAVAANFANTPRYIRELDQTDAGFILLGTAAGQLNQSLDNDPTFGTVMGYTYAMGDLILRDKGKLGTIFSSPIVGAREFARIAENNALKLFELYSGKGTLVAPKSKALLEGEQQITDFANVVKSLNPAIRDYVQQRVSEFEKTAQELMKAGVSQDALKITLSKLSGLAAVEAFEMSVKAEMQAADALLGGNVESLENAASVRRELVAELRTLSDQLLKDVPEGATKSVSEFVGNLQKGLKLQDEKIKTFDELLPEYNRLQKSILVDELANPDKTRATAEIVDDLQDITGIRLPLNALENVKTREQVEDLLKKTNYEAISNIKKDALNLLEKGVSAKIVFSNVQKSNAFTQKLWETQRINLENAGRAGFRQMDADPRLGTAKTDATPLFETLIKDVTDLSAKGAKTINGDALRGGDARALLTVFDGAAEKAILNKFDSEQIKGLKQDMRDQGYKQFTPAFMFDYLNNFVLKDSPNKMILKLGFEDTQKIESALGRLKNSFDKKAQLGDGESVQRSLEYGKYEKIANDLFTTFKSDKDVFIEDIPQLVAKAKETYKLEYADRYRDNPIAKLLIYDRKNGAYNQAGEFVTEISALYPEGKVWSTPVEKWIDMNKLANSTDEASAFNANLLRMFGKKEKPDANTAEFTISKETNPDLINLAKYKSIEWVTQELEKANKLGLDLAGVNTKTLEKQIENIQLAFGTGKVDPQTGNFIPSFTLDDVFSPSGPFSLSVARKNSKEINTIASNTETLLNKAIRGQQKFLKQQVDTMRTNMATILNLDRRIFNAESLFNEVVNKGAIGLDDLKQVAVIQGKMNADDFDQSIRYLVAQHINDSVFKVNTAKEFYGNKDLLAANVIDIDFKKLSQLFEDTEKSKALKDVLGENHYNVIVNISKFLELQKLKKPEVSVMGIPRSLSVESWISRIYSINRGVVSPKYVATEAALQHARKRNLSTLEMIISSEDSAQLFAKIILDQKPLDEKLGKRLVNAIAFHFSYTGSRYGYRDFMVGAEEAGMDIRAGASAVIPDEIEPKGLKPTEEQMTSLKFKKPKKAWGPGTNYKNYEEWKAVNLDSILDPIYMKQF